MKPNNGSLIYLAITRSKSKMFEYSIPQEHHIAITVDPSELLILTIGILGDLTAHYNRNTIVDFEVVKSNLQFAARYFDAYLESKLNNDISLYLIILGSASYYLCGLPGSSKVLAKRINESSINIDAGGLENLLIWLLNNDYTESKKESKSKYDKYIIEISSLVKLFFDSGLGEKDLLKACKNLRALVYENGTPRQLLISDIISAIIKRKLQNSSWIALPVYSGLSKDLWSNTIQNYLSIKELWPAQHLLGEKGVLKGVSAIVQMPTSAGKTKATELIIRSAFLANRTSYVVIVTPFRALCHEIKNSLLTAFQHETIEIDEWSDVLQTDFISEESLNKRIVIVTPEKLIYALRHNSELAANMGLIVFDEGHQFDSGTRGITYELLLTSLKSLLPTSAQKVLISAVISNAKALGEWLNNTDSEVIEGTNLIPTFRYIGFASWLDQLGKIQYVSNENIDIKEFFVPRVIESQVLHKIKKETKEQIFPSRTNSKDTAIFLGLKLVPRGSVAIYCGTKLSASYICAKAVDAYERGLTLNAPNEFSNSEEVKKMVFIHEQNIGKTAIATQGTRLGIFSHHGNTPHGIRLSIEHAMREGLIRFVICTSTLAQGVNLPIRYLIVSSIYQGAEQIKTRDFHNLIGRAGRSGMHTEGSIIFADHVMYDKKNTTKEKWKWENIKKLFEFGNSEPCISNLLSLFDPIKNDKGNRQLKMEAMTFINAYIKNPEIVVDLAKKIEAQYKDDGFSKEGVEKQIRDKMNLISSVESFLVSNWDIGEGLMNDENIIKLAKTTFAYFLADDEKKENICKLFTTLSKSISEHITEPVRRKVFGRTLYGIQDSSEIEKWVKENIINISKCENDDFLDILWPLISKYIKCSAFLKCNKPSLLIQIAKEWMRGQPFYKLFEILKINDAKLQWGSGYHQYKIDHVLELCEGGFSYNGTLLIGAICEFIELYGNENKESVIGKLKLFQKRFKYGLPSNESVILYELGFADRTLAQKMTDALGELNNTTEIKSRLLGNRDKFVSIINLYPSYYQKVYENLR